MQLIKDFIVNSIQKSGESDRAIYMAMGKPQQSFVNMKESGRIYLHEYFKFCEVTGADPTEIFQSKNETLIKSMTDTEKKLLKAYELLIKHGIKFDFSDDCASKH